MALLALLLSNLLVIPPVAGGQVEAVRLAPRAFAACSSLHPRALLGLVARPLTLAEIVTELERGCLALDDVRFRLGQDTIESLSPAQLALVARALGLARGSYRVAVPSEAGPGLPPDTLQARHRGIRLRDELVHYGASSERLLEDPGWTTSALVVAPGEAVPMLIRVQDQ